MEGIYAEFWRNKIQENVMARTRARQQANVSAVRRYRSDPEKRKHENMMRQMRRIKEGMVPTKKAMKEYGITPEMANKAREEGGHEPIDFFPLYGLDIPSTTNVKLEINEATKRQIREQERQKSLAMTAKENADELRDLHKGMKEKFKGQIVEITEEDKVSIKNIANWMRKGLSREKQRSIGTLENRFGTNTNYKNGQLYRVFNRWRPTECDDDITHCLKDMKGLLDFVATMKTESGKRGGPVRDLEVGTKMAYLEAVSITMEEYPLIDHAGELKAQYEMLQHARMEYKAKVGARKLVKKESESITFTFSEMAQKLKSHFGADSWQHMYMSMYGEAPSRDDMFDLLIVDKDGKDPKKVNDGYNYLVLPKNGKATIVFVKYKTAGFFGVVKVPLTSGTTSLIRKYIKGNPMTIAIQKGTLFGKAKMSDKVRKMLIEGGIKTSDQTKRGAKVNVGSINLLRKAYVTDKFENNPSMTEEERIDLASAMRHSPVVTESYVRKVFKEVNENPKKFEKVKYSSSE